MRAPFAPWHRSRACALALSALSGGALSCGGARVTVVAPVFPVSTAWITAIPGNVNGTLASDGERVFVAATDGGIHALDRATGRVLWHRTGPPSIIAARPGLLVARGSDGAVRGLDPGNGRERWSAATGVAGSLPPAFDGALVFVVGVGAVALADGGAVAWSVTDAARASAPPGIAGGCLIVPEEDVVRCRDTATGRSLWERKLAGPVGSAPLADGRGRLFTATNGRRLVSLAASDGDLRWSWRIGTDVDMPPAVFGRSVLFATQEAVLYALNAGNGHLDWRSGLPSRPLSGPLLFGGAVVVACYGGRSSEHVIVGFEAHSGRVLGTLSLPALLQAPPLLLGDRLFAALRDGTVVALQLSALPPPPAPEPVQP